MYAPVNGQPALTNGARVSRSERFAKRERTAGARKAFSQGQGMNKPIGIMYLRPLVGSLSAIIAAILLYGSNHAHAQAPPGIGIMYLTNSDAVGDPIHNWSTDPALTNSLVQGIALRNGAE